MSSPWLSFCFSLTLPLSPSLRFSCSIIRSIPTCTVCHTYTLCITVTRMTFEHNTHSIWQYLNCCCQNDWIVVRCSAWNEWPTGTHFQPKTRISHAVNHRCTISNAFELISIKIYIQIKHLIDALALTSHIIQHSRTQQVREKKTRVAVFFFFTRLLLDLFTFINN